MSKLLIIEDSKMLCKIFTELLTKYTDFDFDIAETYAQAKSFVSKERYQFAVADMNLPDAKSGEVIPLLNKHNIAPIVFTGIFDEDFREGFETSHIVDYVLKERYENILYVVEKLKQLELNKTKTILIVDDSTLYTNFLKQNLLLHHFKVITASNGKEGLEKLEAHPEVELVITDYHMPIMDGLEFVRKARKKRNKKSLSIITLTSDTNSYTTSRFLKEGANDYITKPFSRDEFYSRIYQNIESVAMFEDMQSNFDDDIINLLSDITEFRSAETGSHVKRMGEYSYILSKLSGMFEEEARLIGKLAILHDIGKVTIPDTILCKPGKLDADEFEAMKEHANAGAALLDKAFLSDENVGKIAKEIALHHHERWDGTGYPHGLKGEEIPIHARIVAIVDVFDALINKRVYKDPWELDEILQFIESKSGVYFDPRLIKLFLKNIDCFVNVLHKFGSDYTEAKYCKIV
ncbi:MAG: putative two-component system response regulator [Sulfurimonas sp.]|jgi:putative two-component system response regulator|uniref:response regulator n=1 Tax=Sulfurimonas sp. TaxID=2022749 RepID=UPI0039E614E7